MKNKTKKKLLTGFVAAGALTLCAGLALPVANVSASDTQSPTPTPVFAMDAGAGLYLEGSGVRFSTTVNKAYYDSLVNTYGANATFNFYTLVDKTNNEDKGEEKIIPCTRAITASSFATVDEITYHGVIVYTNVSAENLKKAYAVEMTAQSYVEVVRDGEQPVKVPTTNMSESRSMRAVANYAIQNGLQSEAELSHYYGTVTTDDTQYVWVNDDQTLTIDALSTSAYTEAYVDMNKVGTVENGVITLTETLEVGKKYDLSLFDASNNVYRTSFVYVDEIEEVDVERYALYNTNASETLLSTATLGFNASDVTAMTADGETVNYTASNSSLQIPNQNLGAVKTYTVKAGDSYHVVNATFVENAAKLLKVGNHVNPYGTHSTYKNYSEYTSKTRTDASATYSDILMDGADAYSFVWNSTTASNGDSGAMKFSFKTDTYTGNNTVDPNDYDYLLVDMYAYTNVKLAIRGFNGKDDWSFLVGEDLRDSGIGGGAMYDKATGNVDVYKNATWQTMAFDITHFTTSQLSSMNVLNIVMNGVSKGATVVFANLRLVTAEVYNQLAYTVELGFEKTSVLVNTEATPVVTVGGQTVTDTLSTDNDSVIKLEDGKFIAVGVGEATVSATVTLNNGFQKTVSKTITVVDETETVYLSMNAVHPYGDVIGGYGQYSNKTRRSISSGYTEYNWDDVTNAKSSLVHVEVKNGKTVDNDSGEIQISAERALCGVNVLDFKYLEFEMFVGDLGASYASRDITLTWGLNNYTGDRLYNFASGTALHEKSIGSYGKVGTIYDYGTTEPTTYKMRTWQTVRIDISSITSLNTYGAVAGKGNYTGVGGRFLTIAMSNGQSYDKVWLTNLRVSGLR